MCHLLIDGDILCYRVGFAMDKLAAFSPKMVDQSLNHLRDIYNASSYELYLTSRDRSNFRFKVAKHHEYKSGRSKKPKYFKEFWSYMIDHWKAEEIYGMEADDELSIRLGEEVQNGNYESTILVSTDKDCRQQIGKHGDWEGNILEVKDPLGHLELKRIPYKTKAGDSRTRSQLKGTGLKFFYAQLITGDRCDTVKGLQDKGDVTAYGTLKDCKSEKELYKATLEAYNRDVELMDEMASLVWILKKRDVYWLDHKRELLCG